MAEHEVDYHGSRSYQADEPRTRRLKALIEWLAHLTRRQTPSLGDRAKSGALPLGAKHGFSLLGASSPAPARRTADCPFPVKSGNSPFAPDWRILP